MGHQDYWELFNIIPSNFSIYYFKIEVIIINFYYITTLLSIIQYSAVRTELIIRLSHFSQIRKINSVDSNNFFVMVVILILS